MDQDDIPSFAKGRRSQARLLADNFGSSSFHTLFGKDRRSFPEMLGVWMTAHDCVYPVNDEAFLEKMKLNHVLTPADWQGLVERRHVPNKNLALALALAFEFHAPITQHDIPTLHMFRTSALRAYARGVRDNSPVIHFSHEQYAAFCKPMMEHLCTEALQNNRPLQPENAADARYNELIERIARAQDKGTNTEAVVDGLKRLYAADHENVLYSFAAMLGETGPISKTLKVWADSEFLDKPASLGTLLRFIRHSRNWTQKDMATKLELDTSYISDLENNHHRLDEVRFPHLIKRLGLAIWEYDCVTRAYLPALDPVWLAGKPAKTHARLLIKAFREQRGMIQAELAEKIGVDTQTVSSWERGLSVMSPASAAAFAKALSLDATENDKFTKAMTLARKITPPAGVVLKRFREERRITQEELGKKIGVQKSCVSKWERGTFKIPPYRLPALKKALSLSNPAYRLLSAACLPGMDSAELADSPTHKRPGILLQQLRKKEGLTQEELAQKLGITRKGLDEWERGVHAISCRQIEVVHKALTLKNDQLLQLAQSITPTLQEKWIRKIIEEKRLKCLSFPEFDAEWLAAQLVKKQSGLLLVALREDRKLSQKALALKMAEGANESMINNWESGNRPIKNSRVPHIKKALALTPEEMSALTQAMERRKIYMRAKTTQGVALSPVRQRKLGLTHHREEESLKR